MLYNPITNNPEVKMEIVPFIMAITTAVLCYQNLKLRAKLAEAIEMATKDSLTGLYNRRYFAERLKEEREKVKRYGGLIYVLFIDLNDFKRVNDLFGHEEGDNVLKKAADALKSTLRKMDVIGRYGGDEFVVILTDTKTLGDAEVVAQKLQNSIGSICASGSEKTIGASIGICEVDPQNMTADDPLKAADDAMYLAKNGEKKVVVYQPPKKYEPVVAL